MENALSVIRSIYRYLERLSQIFEAFANDLDSRALICCPESSRREPTLVAKPAKFQAADKSTYLHSKRNITGSPAIITMCFSSLLQFCSVRGEIFCLSKASTPIFLTCCLLLAARFLLGRPLFLGEASAFICSFNG